MDRFFMYLERRPASDSLLLKLGIIVLVVSLIWFAIDWNASSSIEISSKGGTFTEGIVGTPRFVNPVLAVTRADKDMSALIYAGLMKLGPEGSLIPDVAESVTVSDDGLTYNVILRHDVTFHDGTPLTAADVVFTIGRIQDPGVASPYRAAFEGVSADQINEYEVNFVLTESYAPFIENLSVGILPYHIWKDASIEEFPFSQYNSEPIGAGPYKVRDINRDTSGIPQSYVLETHTAYHHGEPQISELVLTFYSNEDSLIQDINTKVVRSAAGISSANLGKVSSEVAYDIQTSPLPRTFALFFNQNKSPALRDIGARKALSTAIDRDALISGVLQGYGEPIYSPIPPGFGIDTMPFELTNGSSTPLDAAREMLRSSGWKVNDETGIWVKEIDDVEVPLSFSISTANNPLFEETAEHLRATWEQLGAEVTVKQFEQSDLTQAIIRPRDYEALLFGTDVGRALDFYSFWHSSQRNDPGLNVSLYANITTDSILSETRTRINQPERAEALTRFALEIQKEAPAVFLFAPKFIYLFPKDVTGASFTGLAEPGDRFASINNWYIETESVWPVFKE